MYPLADIDCTKDSCDVFKGTIKDNLARGINRIVDCKVQFVLNEDGEEGEQWSCSLICEGDADYNTNSDTIHDVQAFMVGDLKFFSQMLGKEGFDSNWCSHCQLNRNEWEVGCEFTIVESTLESIRLLAAESTDATGVDRKGVREDPYFNISVANYIWPILHIKLGHGNAIVKFLLDYADKAVQQVPQEQILLREQVMELNGKLADAGDLRNQWDSDGVESGKEIVKRLRAELKGIPNKTKPAAAGSKQKKLEDEIQTHLNNRAVIMASLKAMRSSRKIKKDKLDGFKFERKTDKDSLLTGIDAILQGYGIKRQAYHGGDLVGGHIGILMERAEDIMNDVETYLIDSKKNLVNNPTPNKSGSSK